MHFLDSWTRLGTIELISLLLPALILAVSLFLPGRRVARIAASGVAVAVLLLPNVIPSWPLGAAWAALWAVAAWQVGTGGSAGGRPTGRAGGVESGMVGLPLGLALLALLVAAVARQDLSHEEGRRASLGLLLMCLGLLHLMLRRDVYRALVAFPALGLGLQILEQAAGGALLPSDARERGTVLLATAITMALVVRLARVRQLDSGSSWVSDAHDLHD